MVKATQRLLFFSEPLITEANKPNITSQIILEDRRSTLIVLEENKVTKLINQASHIIYFWFTKPALTQLEYLA